MEKCILGTQQNPRITSENGNTARINEHVNGNSSESGFGHKYGQVTLYQFNFKLLENLLLMSKMP